MDIHWRCQFVFVTLVLLFPSLCEILLTTVYRIAVSQHNLHQETFHYFICVFDVLTFHDMGLTCVFKQIVPTVQDKLKLIFSYCLLGLKP